MSNRVTDRDRKPANPKRRLRVQHALEAGDIANAAALATAALRAGDNDPLILNLAAWQKEEAGDFRGAHDLLRRALTLAPGDVMIMGSIGALLRKQGHLDEALSVLDQVVAAEPRHAAAWLERGYVLDEKRSDREATASYERALTIDPSLAPALGKLADAAARRGDAAASEAFSNRALVLNQREPSAVFAVALLAMERKDGERAENLLNDLLETPLAPEDRIRSLTLLGDALGGMDRPTEAFAAYVRAQRTFRNTHAPTLKPNADHPSHRSFIERITEQVDRAGRLKPSDPHLPIAGAAITHVFLLGYPRSGTTLIENVLASAPGVVALEERDTLAEIDRALLANDGTMADLDALKSSQLAHLRAAYWARANELGGPLKGKVLVDMNPFNGVKLPILARMFPQARIVIMRRDPRDVVLSCF
ncbi:MAG: sulfotransferase, partial [Acidobacteriota bacterium]|nr:sulfotransferase [Acidobacteriota bacterium]